MSATMDQINKLNLKFKNLDLAVLETSEGGKTVEVFAIVYTKNPDGQPMSEGLFEANAMWDERKSRPAGYYIVDTIEASGFQCFSFMASEDWLDTNKVTREVKDSWMNRLLNSDAPASAPGPSITHG
jgi:hypothetical protein